MDGRRDPAWHPCGKKYGINVGNRQGDEAPARFHDAWAVGNSSCGGKYASYFI
jgi:hypothetical protein